MKLKAVKFGVITFAMLICCSFSVFSQNICNLQINVYEFKDDGSAEQYPVKVAKFKFISSENGKSIKISNKNGVYSANNLAEGKYNLTVSKPGFQKTLKKMSIDCGLINLQNTISEIVFLWKGSSKQTFNMSFDGVAGVTSGATRVKNADSPSSDVNKNASYLDSPKYPSAAKAVGAKGKVEVKVLINELGYVVSAEAVSGHPLLRSASVGAAKSSKFKMTFLDGVPVKVSGIISYIFN